MIRRLAAWLLAFAFKLNRGEKMQGFISINIPMQPTDADLRHGREVIALLASFVKAGGAMIAADKDDEAAAAAFTQPVQQVTISGGTGGEGVAMPLDSSGLPWDERIHSSAKSTNGDGTWKKRRGVQDAEVTRITAEIRAAMGGAGGAVTVPTPPGTAAIPPPPTTAAAPPPPPPPPPVGEVNDFAGLMTKVGKLQQTGKLTLAEFNTCITSSGMPADAAGVHNAIGVSKNLTFIPAINALVDATVAGR